MARRHRYADEVSRLRFPVGIATAFVSAGLLCVGSASAVPDQPCRDYSDACKIEVANTYMDAQAGGPGTREAMRLAPTAIRWENAAITGATGEEIRQRSPGGPSEIWSQRDRDRIWVDGNQVFSIWIVDIRDPGTGEYTNTAHIFERIQVDHLPPGICGDAAPPCVTEIEAIFCISPVGLEEATPEPSGAPQPSALCFRADTF